MEQQSIMQGSIGQQAQQDFNTLKLVLSPRQAHPSPDSLDNWFVCKICLKVLDTPKECNQCQTAFCSECLDKWQAQQRQHASQSLCPLRCQQSAFRDIHRFAKQYLQQTKYQCRNLGCTSVFIYDDRQKHHRECQYRVFICPCGTPYQKGEIDTHAAKCKEVTQFCTVCEQQVKYSLRNEHDCFKMFKAQLHQEQQMRDQYEKGIDMRCPKGHILYPHRGPAIHQDDLWNITVCDSCNKESIQKDKIYWRCLFTCNYDLCYKCLYQLKK